MALFENVNLDALKEKAGDLAEKATDLAQAGVAKSRELAEIAKLKAANLSEEDAIKKAYVELGKLYYAERGAAPEAAYISGCEKITAAKAAIAANNERIAQLREPAQEPEIVHTVEAEDQPAPEAEQPAAGEAEAPQPEAAPGEDDGIHLTL